MRIGIIVGSVREGRLGESVGEWVLQIASGRDASYELIDLKSFDLPLLTSPVPPAMANRQYNDERVSRWGRAIDDCDGFVFVSPEYNHSVPGAFKNAVDSIGPEWQGKPVGFVAYASEDGIRAVEAWRQILANFSMPTVRNQVSLNLFTDVTDGKLTPSQRHATRLTAILDELETLITKLR